MGNQRRGDKTSFLCHLGQERDDMVTTDLHGRKQGCCLLPTAPVWCMVHRWQLLGEGHWLGWSRNSGGIREHWAVPTFSVLFIIVLVGCFLGLQNLLLLSRINGCNLGSSRSHIPSLPPACVQSHHTGSKGSSDHLPSSIPWKICVNVAHACV